MESVRIHLKEYLNERNEIQCNPRSNFGLREQDDLELKVSGESSIYLETSTTYTFSEDLKISRVLNTWVELYLVSLRILESEGIEKPSPERISALKEVLEEKFEVFEIGEYSDLIQKEISQLN